MERSRLNEIYIKLDKKARALAKTFGCGFGWYNGHYHRGESGDYAPDYFPIPVVTVDGVCDIEIDLDGISVTTKLTKNAALSYDFKKLEAYSFEVYGEENYLDDFYIPGGTVEAMIEKISESTEKNVFFSFYFPSRTAPDTLFGFVGYLRTEGFFY